MILEPIRCPACSSDAIVKNGKTSAVKQRYLCTNRQCDCQSFVLENSYKGRLPEIKAKIVDMALNGSGVRDTARVLKVSPTTVIDVLKKRGSNVQNVNKPVLERTDPASVEVEIHKVVDEAEIDEMWSFVGSKDKQRWLWHAIDHATGEVLAFVFGRRKDSVFLELKSLLEPFGISKFFSDDLGTYNRHIDPEKLEVTKKNLQKIERKHLTLRTRIKRLARKTICFSKSVVMHDAVIGLFINRHEFCLDV